MATEVVTRTHARSVIKDSTYPRTPYWFGYPGYEKDTVNWIADNEQNGLSTAPIQIATKVNQTNLLRKGTPIAPTSAFATPRRPEHPKKKVSFSEVIDLKCLSCGAETNHERKSGLCACKVWNEQALSTKKLMTEGNFKSAKREVVAEPPKKLQRPEEVTKRYRQLAEPQKKVYRPEEVPNKLQRPVEPTPKLQRPAQSTPKTQVFGGPVWIGSENEKKYYPQGAVVMPLQG